MGTKDSGANPERVVKDRWYTLAEVASQRLNRRGFLGVVGKGAAVVAGLLAGIAPLGANVKTALACRWCEGCIANWCSGGLSSCASYYYEGGGQSYYTCQLDCRDYGRSCKAYGATGFFANFCPCGPSYSGC